MSSDGSPSINVTRGRNTTRGKSGRAASSPSIVTDATTLVSTVARTARQTWLAGLGVLSVAEEAGGKVFDALVEEGKSWEQARREQRAARARQVQTVAEYAGGVVEAVEERMRDGVNDVLHRLGAPHRDDVKALRNRVEALSEKLDRLVDAASEGDRGKSAR